MVTVMHEKSSQQFVAVVEGKTAYLDYDILNNGTLLDYHHTFVPPELRGRNIAQDIVKFALEYAKQNHLHIKPSCPYVERYIEKHPEYQSLIAGGA